MSDPGTSISQALSLHFVFHNRAAFLEHFIRKAWVKKNVKARYFHLPAMHADDAGVFGGRSHGKSFAILEPRIVQGMFCEPDEESVLSSFRKLHIKDRVENVIMILNRIQYFKAFIGTVRRDPHYEVRIKNGHVFFGISVGDDPLAISIQGKHPKCLLYEQTIKTTKGSIAIGRLQSLIKKEDIYVHAFNIEQNCIVQKKVLRVFKNSADGRKIIRIILEDRSNCQLTKDHKMFCIDGSGNIIKREAGSLSIGDKVVTDEPLLNKQQFDMCLGGLLGDSSLMIERWKKPVKRRKYQKSANYRIAFGHSSTHNDYVEFKKFVMSEFVTPRGITVFTKRYTGQYGHDMSKFYTVVNYEFTRLAHLFDVQEGSARKIISRQVLDQVTLPALAIWFCDDGSMFRGKCGKLKGMFLHTERYGKEQSQIICNWLLERFNVRAEVRGDGRGFWKVSIPATGGNAARLLQMIAPYAPKTLAYKFACIELGDLSILGSKMDYWFQNDKRSTWSVQTKEIIKIEEVQTPRKTLYDIEVEDVHNYYAGGLLVSNCRYIEETSAFPMHAWKQWQSTVHPAGCHDLYCGVVDGRVDTPFRHLDTPGDPAIDKLANKRFHIPRYFDPWWNEALKQDCIKNLGGENADEYLQQVKAKWGSPASAVWDILAIYDCMHRDIVCPRLEYDATIVDDFSEIYLPEKPNNTKRIALGIDTGYTEPTEIAAFALIEGRWRMFARVGLRGKIIYETQVQVIDKIATHYNAEFMGIDSTGSPVLASLLTNPAGAYKDKDYADRVVEVSFNENVEFEINGEKKKLKCKNFSTDFLRSMFKKRLFEMPLDEELVNQFNSEKQKKTSAHTIILTPDNVHITDSFRCFVVAYFKKYQEDFIEQDRRDMATVLPIAANSGVFRSNNQAGSIVDRIAAMFPGLRKTQ